jgi:hypothetical protein
MGARSWTEAEYVHINGREGAVGDGAAYSTGNGESGVEVDARGFCRVGGGGIRLYGIELGRARRRGRSLGSHCACIEDRNGR